MWHDEVLAEIYKYREEYAKSFDYNLHAIVEDLEKKQAASGRQIISTPIIKPNQQENKFLVET
ncbi:MAG TPA: hypothetical protein DCQ63_12510 [Planktothrix sp. UBA8402]|jgi:hypothetical protein|nr:hypothetical protein [Planktothrix sp. UBA8402]